MFVGIEILLSQIPQIRSVRHFLLLQHFSKKTVTENVDLPIFFPFKKEKQIRLDFFHQLLWLVKTLVNPLSKRKRLKVHLKSSLTVCTTFCHVSFFNARFPTRSGKSGAFQLMPPDTHTHTHTERIAVRQYPKIGNLKNGNSFFSVKDMSFDIFVVTFTVTNFLPKLVDMLLFSMEKKN